ncbi:MAG: histidine phosphatase family protein [Proteobacteria bacterium]|nr:histidine phosphatase family protein [Desulfobulbaceae bacterium]MBU4154260.1 histidine phosphatase family protein [Pseudomonadota bacterium]MDP2104376.1 histidine phosphatase family protein [Desulfobulbaceae bacterium]
MRLFLARHGETGSQYSERYIGATDLPLSELGRQQAMQLADVLPKGVTRCLCSPLHRARETASLALRGRDCLLMDMEALREVDFGRWEGLSFPEIVDQDQALVDEWQQNPTSFQFPEGESVEGFRQRVQEGLMTIVALPDKEVLVVCHGGVIRAMLCALLGLSFANYLSFAIAPAALTVVVVDGHRGVLHGLNLTALASGRRGES